MMVGRRERGLQGQHDDRYFGQSEERRELGREELLEVVMG